jgi:hypothetical protein
MLTGEVGLMAMPWAASVDLKSSMANWSSGAQGWAQAIWMPVARDWVAAGVTKRGVGISLRVGAVVWACALEIAQMASRRGTIADQRGLGKSMVLR